MREAKRIPEQAVNRGVFTALAINFRSLGSKNP